jgi:hypothetical protein
MIDDVYNLIGMEYLFMDNLEMATELYQMSRGRP